MNPRKIIGSLVFILCFCFQFQLQAQFTELPFKSGERLHYKVAYNWHFVWVEAGKVEFSVDSAKYGDAPAYHFKSFGRTLTSYDWIYKVRDQFESLADAQSLLPFWFKQDTREGSYRVNNKLNFDYANNVVIAQTESSNRPAERITLPLNNTLFDVQTAVYHARSLDFGQMIQGEKIPFNLIIDGQVYEIFGRYLGKEMVENYDGKRYRCHKFSVLLVEGTIFSGGEDLFIWVTDDRNKIPILVEAKILVGSVKAYFVKGENLKFPLDATLKD